MPKHKKRHREEAETLPVDPTVQEVRAMTREPEEMKSVENINLANIRNETVTARTGAARTIGELEAETARTIVELEAWRDEIDATIAFLRAQRK